MMRVATAFICLLCLASCDQSDRGNPTSGPIRVDAGSHKLEVLIEGVDRGRPTVILESGLGGGIDGWATVRESLGQITRVVSYNRAGIGGSQPGSRPRSAGRIVEELRTVLQTLDIAPPYVLVGHSIGGLYVRAFAGLHPDEVSGLVLVDPTMEFRESLTTSQVDVRLQQHWGSDYKRIQKLLDRVHPKMAAIAAQSMLGLAPYLEQLPMAQRKATRDAWLDAFADRFQQIEGMLGLMSDAERQELFATMESMRVVRESPADGKPVTLLIAGKATDGGMKDDAATDPTKSADYIAWSQNERLQRFAEYIETVAGGKMQILRDAGHNIPKDRPDAIIDAVTRSLSSSSQQ